MTSMMHTPSHSRQHYHSMDVPSMLDSLPNVNFGYDDLRERMAQFTARFDDFIDRGRKRVLEERNHFRLNLAELQESQRARKRELEDISNKSLAHQDTLERESQEQDELQQAIDHLKIQREDHQTYRDDLKSQITQIQKSIQVRRQAQQQHQRILDNQAHHNLPELHFWESNLCMHIDGSENEDRLKFTFTHVDERDWDRECSFDLDMAGRKYDIVSTHPKLEHDDLDAVLERLAETRDLAAFLKAMRCLFIDALTS